MPNSIFKNSVDLPSGNEIRSWKNHNSSGDNTISSIEKYFNPEDIRKVVNSLVLSRFQPEPEAELISNNGSMRSPIIPGSTGSSLSINYSEISGFSESGSDDEHCSFDESITSDSLDENLIVLEATKKQILRAIEYDKNHNRKLTTGRLEAEKLLLITDIKLDSLRCPSREERIENDLSSGNVELSNIRFYPEDPHYLNHYFFCLITYGPRIFSSEVLKVTPNGITRFSKKFTASCVPYHSKFRIKIYSVPGKVFKRASICLRCNSTEEDDNISQTGSRFTLVGEAYLKLSKCIKEKFALVDIKPGTGVFAASLSCRANINFTMKGFLTLSFKYPLWQTQWCVLKGRFLNCYNYPSDESYYCKPTCTIDLVSSAELMKLSSKESPRKHTFVLKINEKKIYISCESLREFKQWSRYIEVALAEIKKWENS